MSATLSLSLGLAFAAIGFAAAVLQYWLWTFPMTADPSGRDPNGITTAPRFWRFAHRILGYAFSLIYAVLLVPMTLRLPYLVGESGDLRQFVHAAAGLAIAPVLLVKVWILRFRPRFGKSLIKLGSVVQGLALLTVGLVVGPAAQLATLPISSSTDSFANGLVKKRCVTCHGATPLVNGEGDDSWPKVLEEMREKALDWGRPDPAQSDAPIIAGYLQRVLPRLREEDGRRGRGRKTHAEVSEDD